jgi:3-dehydrosphinganine reductase
VPGSWSSDAGGAALPAEAGGVTAGRSSRRHAVISGGSSGIGLALAERLAAAGWDLTILARDRARLAAAKARLVGSGAAVSTRSVDVADAEGVERAVAGAIDAHGPPALVVACAGMVVPLRFHDQPLDDFRRTIEVNYLGSVHLVRAALPAMRAQAGGRIVLVASGAALIGLYGYTSYAPSKFAVRGLAEALRSELRPDGIAVSVVYPPDTDTPGYREEVRRRPAATSRAVGTAGLLSADAVARATLAGIERGRFAIAPGLAMHLLQPLHSLVGPLLHRFWLDPRIARALREKVGHLRPLAGDGRAPMP